MRLARHRQSAMLRAAPFVDPFRRSMRPASYGLTVAGILTVLVLATGLFIPSAAALEPSTTGFVLDSETGNSVGGGQLVDAEPSTLSATATTGNSTDVTVMGSGWTFVFTSSAPSFAIQTYSFGPADLDISNNGVVCSGTNWSFRVLELPVIDAAGVVQAFAADFWARCGNETAAIHGSLRVGSALPTRLIRVQSATMVLPSTVVGSTSANSVVTVTNVGGANVALQAGVKTGSQSADFAVDDGCGLVSLDSGQSCTLSLSFSPTSTTTRAATFTIPTDTFDATRAIRMSGYGVSPLTLIPSALVVHSRGGSGEVAGPFRFEPALMTAQVASPALKIAIPDWQFLFFPPTGEALAAGTYSFTSQTPANGLGGLLVSAPGMSCTGDYHGSFTVLDEPVIDTDNTVLQFAADYRYSCGSDPDEVRGWVRFHSYRPVPSGAPAAYTIGMNRTTATVGQTIVLTPQPAGIDLFRVKRCTLSIKSTSILVEPIWMQVASDDCSPWSFTLPPATPGEYQITGTLYYGDSPNQAGHAIDALNKVLTVSPGGTAGTFVTNYPVLSWAPNALLGDVTPAYGTAQTVKAGSGWAGCRLAWFGGYEGAFTEQHGGCSPWTFTVPAPTPNTVASVFGSRGDVHVTGWSGTSTWSIDNPELPFIGARRGETYQSAIPDFTGTGGSYTSSLPAIFTGPARAEVFYANDSATHSYLPVVRGVSSGTCNETVSGATSPVVGGSCASYTLPAPIGAATQVVLPQLELRDSGGDLLAGASTSVAYVQRLAPITITAPSTVELGSAVTVKAGDAAGIPVAWTLSASASGTAGATVQTAAIAPAWQQSGTFVPTLRAAGGVVSRTISSLARGSYTLTATFKDLKGTAQVEAKALTIVDTKAPAGTVAIAGGAALSRLATVSVSVPASDLSGIAVVGLSNDGATWTYRSYNAIQLWTLSATNGTRTVYVKWKDGAGNWSAVKSDTIVLDTVAPTLTAPTWRIGTAGTALVGGAMPVRLAWTGADATSGVANYFLIQSVDGGAWTTISSTLIGTNLTRNLVPGHTYRFGVRAVDKAGNVAGYAYGPRFRLSAIQQSSTSVKYAGTWATSTSTTWWGGTARSSSRFGSTASVTITGRQFDWIGLKGPNRGRAQVYVNGVLTSTIDLYAASQQARRVVWSRVWSSSATRTIKIRVLATSGRPRVDVDGFVFGN